MDMQNVSNLVIPEGEVRTIHDENSRLLWGRVSYDVKYAGDSSQQTYSGKNLFNTQTLVTNWRSTVVSYDNNNVTIKPTTNASCYVRYSIAVKPSTNYTISFDKAITGATTFAGRVSIYKYNGSTDTLINDVDATNTLTFTTGADTVAIRVYLYCMSGTDTTWENIVASYSNIQLEEGGSKTAYEPYTGGIPSPNPDYPQAISVVTGMQTVTLSDGVVSEDYTVGLGSLELCKIGAYQDYIYKSGSDWYVHKEVAKVVLDGTEAWTKTNNAFQTDASVTPNKGSVALDAFSDYYVHKYYASSITTNIKNGEFGWNSGKVLTIRNDSCADAPAFKVWLTSHNTSIYYTMSSPTETQITDTTLIGQLNAVHEWLTRYGYNATVTGNLPIIIDRANL